MRSNISLFALSLLLHENVACSGCGEGSCASIYNVEFEKATPWESGEYHFEIILDDTNHFSCDFPLPTPPCDEDWTFCRDPDGLISFGIVYCPDGPAPQEIAGIWVHSTEVKQVALTITRDDTVLVDVDLAPKFEVTQPNGEGCEPTCLEANDRVMIP